VTTGSRSQTPTTQGAGSLKVPESPAGQAAGKRPGAASLRGSVPPFVLSAVGVVLVALTMRQAVAGVPPILADLGLDARLASILVSVPVLCFSLGALAGPALRARLGEERAIFLVVALLLGGLTARAVSPAWALLPGTILAGLSIAVLNVLLPSLVKRRFADRVGAMMASYTVAMAVGSSLAAGLTFAIFQAAGGSINVALGVWAVVPAVALICWLPQLRAATMTHGATTSTAGRVAHNVIGSGQTGRAAVPIWRHPLAWHVTFYMGLQSTGRSPGCRPSSETEASIQPSPASCCCCSMALGSSAT